jgi:16S rRNA processing protein RimM
VGDVTPESSALPGEGLLLVGRVARAHGIRGQVIVNPETDFMEERFRIGQRVLVGSASRPREYEIEDVRFHQGRPIVRFGGVDTMNDAEALAGSELWLREAELEPLPPGTFYRHDLVGCEVRRKGGEVLGRVTAVEGSIDRSYLVVDEHMMIPLVADICVAVDIANRQVTIDPPEGLIDLNPPVGRPR